MTCVWLLSVKNGIKNWKILVYLQQVFPRSCIAEASIIMFVCMETHSKGNTHLTQYPATFFSCLLWVFQFINICACIYQSADWVLWLLWLVIISFFISSNFSCICWVCRNVFFKVNRSIQIFLFLALFIWAIFCWLGGVFLLLFLVQYFLVFLLVGGFLFALYWSVPVAERHGHS